MAETFSTMLPLGTQAPAFHLLDVVTNQSVSLDKIKSSHGTVIMFICNHCPYVIHIHQKLLDIAQAYLQKGIRFVAINSNDVNAYPADSPSAMQARAMTYNYPFPYLFDETQSVAKAYQAACTPDFYVFDKDLRCVYRGRFDNSTPGNNQPVTGADLKNALDQLLKGESISSAQQPSVGCNIKWKK